LRSEEERRGWKRKISKRDNQMKKEIGGLRLEDRKEEQKR